MSGRKHYLLFAGSFLLCIILLYYNAEYKNQIYADEDLQISTVNSDDFAQILQEELLDSKKCPDERYLTVEPGGGLGNVVWEYMSLYAVWKLYGEALNLIPFVSHEMTEMMETTFEQLSVRSTSSGIQALCVNYKEAQFIQLIQPVQIEPEEKKAVILARYSARYEEVIQYGLKNIKQELRFKKEHIGHIEEKFRLIKEFFNMKKDDNVTFVGVHYRGTDYLSFLSRNYNKGIDGRTLYNYYLKAMTFFKVKYKRVIFIMVSIDYEWLRIYAPHLRSQFNMTVNPNGDSREDDFVLLSYCNHSIISYGTFGATSAFFAEGTTFVYDLKLPLDHRGPTVAMGMADLLPKWYKLA